MAVPTEDIAVLEHEFGRRIRRRREELGISQEDLAKRCGLHRTYIGSVERGRRNVSLVNIVRIADALRIDPSRLVWSLHLDDESDATTPVALMAQ